MLRTASVLLSTTEEQGQALAAVRRTFTVACNQLVPMVVAHRCWNRVDLHHLAYSRLRADCALGSQMVCNAIASVCNAYRSQKALGRISRGRPVPSIRFNRVSVHYDKRTYTLKGESVSLYTLAGRINVTMRLGAHQRRILESGRPKEAQLVFRNGKWFFNLVVESCDPEPVASGPAMGVDVGENTLAATSTGKVLSGGCLRDRRDRHLALRRRLQSNGSQSARQKLRQVSGKERRRVRHINHETSKAIVAEAATHGVRRITMENLTRIRSRIRAGRRTRARLHRWAFRQLQFFIEYKARALGLEVLYVDPAYSSQTCSGCGCLGRRLKHRFVCVQCGFQAHADLNASRNLAWIGGTAVLPKAAVNTPNVENVGREIHVLQ